MLLLGSALWVLDIVAVVNVVDREFGTLLWQDWIYCNLSSLIYISVDRSA